MRVECEVTYNFTVYVDEINKDMAETQALRILSENLPKMFEDEGKPYSCNGSKLEVDYSY